MEKFEFPTPHPNDMVGYSIFPNAMEIDQNIFFHGTAESNLHAILETGFKAFPPLDSVAFAKGSSLALGHACTKRKLESSPNGVVIAVQFQSIDLQRLVEKGDHVLLYDLSLQPNILGTCVVPECYKHL